VHYYLLPNGRDGPDDMDDGATEAPTIEGEAQMPAEPSDDQAA
jgi:hypothetical protein